MSESNKTCLITFVEPGMPNAVLKVHPAEQEVERVWLDNRPGIERKAYIMQFLKQHCVRGKYVPDPAYLHTPGAKPEDVNTLLIQPHEYPVVELDGAVLDAPPPKERISRPKPADEAKVSQDKISSLENRVNQLTDALGGLVAAMSQNVAVTRAEPIQEPVAGKRGPGRPRKSE